MKTAVRLVTVVALVGSFVGLATANDLTPPEANPPVAAAEPAVENQAPSVEKEETLIDFQALTSPDRNYVAICQPGVFKYYCKEIWGTAQGRCGANTWRWTQCKQYQSPNGQKYYQECGPVQETCTPPGGAECVPCL